MDEHKVKTSGIDVEGLVEALEAIAKNAPTKADFELGGKYDYEATGNAGDDAEKASAMTHLWAAKIARKALEAHAEKGGDNLRTERVWCSCGDAIMPNDGAKCGNCVASEQRHTVRSISFMVGPVTYSAKCSHCGFAPLMSTYVCCPKCTGIVDRSSDENQS